MNRRWNLGDHASVTAPTGFGKSHLVTRGLLPMWRFVLMVDVKGDDPELKRAAGKTVSAYPSKLDLYSARHGDFTPHFRVTPGGLGERARFNLGTMFNEAWAAASRNANRGGGIKWAIYLDEARVIADQMKMKEALTKLWVMGRSKGLTIIGSTQAPRCVPSEYWDQPRWHWIGPIQGKRVIDSASERIGVDVDMVRDTLPELEWSKSTREFLVLGPDRYAAITSL